MNGSFWEKLVSRAYLPYLLLFFVNMICWQGWYQVTYFFVPEANFNFHLFIFTSVLIIFSIITGKLVDISLNRRKMIVLGFLLYIIGYLFSFAVQADFILIEDYSASIIFAVILGIAFGNSTIAIGTYFGDITPPRDRGKLQGISYCISFVIGFFLIYTLTLDILIIFILSILGISLIIFNIFYKPLSQPEAYPKELGFSSYKSVFHNRFFIYYVISFLLFMIALPFIKIFTGSPGIPAEFTNISMFIYYPILAGFAFLGGLWIDKFGRKSMVLCFFLILGLGFTIWGIVNLMELSTLIIIWVLFSIGNALTNTIDYVIPSDYSTAYTRGKHLAIFFVAINSGLLISLGLQPIIENLPIATIALIVTSLLLFAICPIILTTEPIEEALAKEVEVKGIYVITQDGRCLVEMSFKDVLIDTDLITSALSAVGSLIKESIHSEKRLSLIDHGDVKILVEYGQHVNSALIADKETPDIRERLAKFLIIFEATYQEFITKWTGDVRPFYKAYKLIERYFGVYLSKK